MGLIKEAAGAAMDALIAPGAGGAVDGGAGAPRRKKSMRDDIPTDSDSDDSSSTPGSDDQKRPSFMKRFGQNMARSKGIGR